MEKYEGSNPGLLEFGSVSNGALEISTRVLAILVDALRYDYVSETDTPFIHRLAEQGIKLPLKPILGYSDAIRATIFTGSYPDKHGYWMSYSYSPETSPFKALRLLRFVDLVPSDLVRRGFKFVLSSTVCKLLARVSGYSTLHIRNMPFSIIDRFDVTLRESMLSENAFSAEHPTIFDVLRENRTDFAYFDSSILKYRLLAQIARLNPETRFVMVYLHYIDQSSHWSGLRSSEFTRVLRSVDALTKLIVQVVARVWGEQPFVMVFSDHGMIEEKSRTDLGDLGKLKGFGKDFIFVLDATMVRLWYSNREARQRARQLLKRIGHCRQLANDERKALGIDFNSKKYGEDIFLFEPGHVIFPNFHSYVRPRAMHAYDPEHPTQRGVYVLRAGNGFSYTAEDAIKLVDIMPTILALLGLPAPSTCQGRAIVGRNSPGSQE